MKARSIDFLFLSAFVFLGVCLLMGYNFYHRFDKSNELVDHSFKVQNQILEVESEFRNMVSNQRSYLLTEDKDYLFKYNEGKLAIKIATDELSVLISDNPLQIKNLDTLRANFQRRLETLNQELALREKQLFPIQLIRKHIISSTYDTESFIKEIQEMKRVEDKLMSSRLNSQIEGEEKMPLLFAFLGILSIATIAFTYFKLKNVLQEKVLLLINKRRLLKKLSKSNEELEHYAYVASHDLQEPLRKIRMFTDLTKKAYEENETEKIHKYIQKIDASSEKAIELAKRLMSHAQLNKEEDDLLMASVSDIFRQVALELKESHEPEIELKAKIEETPKLHIYPNQIAILFRNLIGNSIKYKKETINKVVVSLKYDLYKDGDFSYHRIQIKDNGIGFKTEFSEKIFDLFNDLNLSAKSSKKSIGLNACKKIMENHYGSISAKSTPDKGATFTCLFPVEN